MLFQCENPKMQAAQLDMFIKRNPYMDVSNTVSVKESLKSQISNCHMQDVVPFFFEPLDYTADELTAPIFDPIMVQDYSSEVPESALASDPTWLCADELNAEEINIADLITMESFIDDSAHPSYSLTPVRNCMNSTESSPSTREKRTKRKRTIQKKCVVPQCTRNSQRGEFCIRHGGGKRCVVDECTNAVQSKNRCKKHGGGLRCQKDGCEKSSQGGGFCRAHGGGKKCAHPGCDKGTQLKGLCAQHGGSRRCKVEGCVRNSRGQGFCAAHGGGKRCSSAGCKHPARKAGKCTDHCRL